ncbi:LOB domain-containing protein 18 [Senna tora]|uniref:LOB domain-containing protein 18 n=1 Tax=Senna tora TaxID=362788 RepID=A0A834WM56_9FABA|nr:LOB domain-containing protein 18 [Senna tora]
MRRKCVAGCIFAPYFDSEQGATHFAAVHKVFGASNVSKLLQNIPVHKRLDAVVTICFEAQARLRDPVYGSLSISDIPFGSASSHTATYDLSSLFDPTSQTSWATQQRTMDLRPYGASGAPSASNSGAGGSGSGGSGNSGGDLHALARELLHKNRSSPSAPMACSNASTSSPSPSK